MPRTLAILLTVVLVSCIGHAAAHTLTYDTRTDPIRGEVILTNPLLTQQTARKVRGLGDWMLGPTSKWSLDDGLTISGSIAMTIKYEYRDGETIYPFYKESQVVLLGQEIIGNHEGMPLSSGSAPDLLGLNPIQISSGGTTGTIEIYNSSERTGHVEVTRPIILNYPGGQSFTWNFTFSANVPPKQRCTLSLADGQTSIDLGATPSTAITKGAPTGLTKSVQLFPSCVPALELGHGAFVVSSPNARYAIPSGVDCLLDSSAVHQLAFCLQVNGQYHNFSKNLMTTYRWLGTPYQLTFSAYGASDHPTAGSFSTPLTITFTVN